MQSLSKRQAMLAAALVLTLGAAAWLDHAEDASDGVVLPGVRPHTAMGSSAGKIPAKNAVLHAPVQWPRSRVAHAPGDLFPDAQTTEAESVAEVAPARPEMPPSPFVYVGKLVDEGLYRVFLSQGERNFTVQNGDVIDHVWKVEAIRPPTMVLSYLPLKTRLILPIGEPD